MKNKLLILLLICTLAFAQGADYKRGADQTYLTYPEWFLVFSPQEYAYFLKDAPSYQFNFIGHIAQFWYGYYKMYEKIQQKGYAFNTGYHVMILTIGLSTTVEYAIKYWYGKNISQFVALTQSNARVSEQDYGAKVAQEYVDFIKDKPWYKFDFASKFKGIYTKNDFFGKNFLRKMERKEALGFEYGVKYIYAKLIGYLTEVGYDTASDVTYVELLKNKQITEKKFPRYDKFKNVSLHYIQQGYSFKSIAKNDANTTILYSLIADTSTINNFECIIKTPILSNKAFSRCVNDIKISQLADFVKKSNLQIVDGFLPPKGSVKLEHIFDF